MKRWLGITVVAALLALPSADSRDVELYRHYIGIMAGGSAYVEQAGLSKREFLDCMPGNMGWVGILDYSLWPPYELWPKPSEPLEYAEPAVSIRMK